MWIISIHEYIGQGREEVVAKYQLPSIMDNEALKPKSTDEQVHHGIELSRAERDRAERDRFGRLPALTLESLKE